MDSFTMFLTNMWNWLTNNTNLIAALAAVAGLFFTGITLRKDRETRELQTTENIVNNLQNLERELNDKYAGKSEEEQKKWDILFFNQLEWFSFLINTKKIKDKKIIEFFKPAMTDWYEKIFIIHADDTTKTNDDFYSEFKKLYKRFKNNTI